MVTAFKKSTTMRYTKKKTASFIKSQAEPNAKDVNDSFGSDKE